MFLDAPTFTFYLNTTTGSVVLMTTEYSGEMLSLAITSISSAFPFDILGYCNTVLGVGVFFRWDEVYKVFFLKVLMITWDNEI